MARPYIESRNRKIQQLRYRRNNPLAPKDIVQELGLSSESVVWNACRKPSKRSK